MNISGRCHCGKIAYEARIDPDNVVICHCTDCQTISGAPWRANVPVLMEKFQLRGEPKTYVKIAASGNAIVLSFCGECGTALYSSKRDNATYLNLRLGAVAERAQLAPKKQGWCSSAMPWAMDIRAVPEVPVRGKKPDSN